MAALVVTNTGNCKYKITITIERDEKIRLTFMVVRIF